MDKIGFSRHKSILIVVSLLVLMAILSISLFAQFIPKEPTEKIKATTIEVDAVFTTLKLNDPKGKAVFTLDNSEKEYDKGALTFEFNEVRGKVKSFQLKIKGECIKAWNETTYKTKETCEKNTNGTLINGTMPKEICVNETTIDKVIPHEESYECWKEVDSILKGNRDYKIDADIEWDRNGGYEIDWIPIFTTDLKEYKAEKWAWWNSSFESCRNITLTGPTSTLTNFPFHVHLDNTTNMKAAGADIRIVGEPCFQGGNELKFEIEKYASNDVDLWVKHPSLTSAGDIISVYYNNSAANDGQDAADVWNDDYLAVWHKGGVSDSTGNSHDMTNNGASTTTGAVDGAYDYELDDSDYMYLADHDDFSFTSGGGDDDTPFTISAFIKPESSHYGPLISKATNTYQELCFWGDRTNNKLYGNLEDTVGNIYIYSDDDSIVAGTEYHVSWTYTGNKLHTGLKLFIDGEQTSTTSGGSGYGGAYNGPAQIRVGSIDFSSPYYFDGIIDEVRVETINRTIDWINYAYQNIANQSSFVTIGDEEEVPAGNNAPVINDPLTTITVFHNQDINLTPNATDADGDTMTWYMNDSRLAIATGDTSCNISWDPSLSDYDMDGIDVTYWVDDGNGGNTSDTFIIYVNNTAPNINDYCSNHTLFHNVNYDCRVNGTDPESDTITWTRNDTRIDISSNNVYATMTDNPSLSDYNIPSCWNVTYTASDTLFSTTTSFMYCVNNSAPSIDDYCTNITIFDDETLSCRVNGTDAESDTITWTKNTTEVDISSNDVYAIISDNPSASDYNLPGCWNITYTASDTELSTTSSFMYCIDTNEAPLLENFTMQDTSGGSTYYFGEYIDYFRIDQDDTHDGGTLSVYITLTDPDGTVKLNNALLSTIAGNTEGYETDISLDVVGNWSIVINTTDTRSLTAAYNTSFLVSALAINTTGRLYGYDFEDIIAYTTINESIEDYEYYFVELRINTSTNWDTVSNRIRLMKNESQITVLTLYDNLSNMANTLSYIDNYVDLIDGDHLNAMRMIKLYVDAEENSSNSAIINNITKRMFQNVSNKIPIYIRNYNHTNLSDTYSSIDPYFYITFSNASLLISQEISYMRENISESRFYYDLNSSLKTSAYNWQNDIIDNFRSDLIVTDYSNSEVAELSNNDLIIGNSNSTQETFDIHLNDSIIGYDIYDLSTKRIIELATDGNISFSVDANSGVVLYVTNLSRIETQDDDDIYLYSTGTTSYPQTTHFDSSVNAFQFVSSSANPDDARIFLTDPTYDEAGFYVWYGQDGCEAIGDWSKYDLVIISDHSNGEWVGDIANLTETFGYIAVNEYGNENNPVGCVYGVDCVDWNRTYWMELMKADIITWTDIQSNVNVFIDGLDIGEVNDVDGLFGDALIELTDDIRISKQRKAILNTYTSYESYANLGDYTMRESACARWDNTVENPSYSYESIDLDVTRANFHKIHGITVLAQTFGAITDYEKAYYCYMQNKVLYGDLMKYSFNQPKFEYTGATDDFQWNYYKYPPLGAAIEDDFTITGDVYTRKFENGIVSINATSRTTEYENAEVITQIEFCSYFYDNDDGVDDEGYMHFKINDNMSKMFSITDDDLTAFVKTWKCQNISTDFYEPSGFYEMEFYYLDNDADYTGNSGLYMYHGTTAGNDRLSDWDQTLNSHPSNDETDYTYYATGDNWAVNFTITATSDVTALDQIDTVVTRATSGDATFNVNYTADNPWDLSLHDRKQFINQTNFAGITVNGTTLNYTDSSACTGDSPAYSTSIVDGETWQACYYDPAGDGYYVRVVLPGLPTSAYTVSSNTAPVIDDACGNVTIFHNVNLNCTYNISDADGDSITSYINDTRINLSALGYHPNISDNPSLSEYNIDEGCWNISFNATDGTAWVYSSFMYCIDNSIPIMTNVSILPSLVYTGDSLLGYCNATDAENDFLIYEYLWYNGSDLYVNGTYLKEGSISTGYTHTCGIRSSDSRVMCWGNGTNGLLGDGDISIHEMSIPTNTTDTDAYKSVYAGRFHTCGIRSSDNKILCWGTGYLGRLGDGDTTIHYNANPTLTTDNSAYSSISLGYDHTCGIRSSDSRVMCWGYGNFGQLGDGDTSNHRVGNPTVTTDTDSYKNIFCGVYHTCGIRSNDGRVMCWGEEDYGKLGNGNNGTSGEVGNPMNTSDTNAYLSISAGYDHTCGIRSNDNRVVCWGHGAYGQLGDGNTGVHYRGEPMNTSDISAYKSVSCGHYHTCGIRSNDSRVMCWGYGAYGQLGDNNIGVHEVGNPTVTTDTDSYKSICGGHNHVCGIRSNDSRVMCWGKGNEGQLGDGDISDHEIGNPTNTTDTHSYVSGFTSGEEQLVSTLGSTFTRSSENWTFACRAEDYISYSDWLNTSILISNSIPVINLLENQPSLADVSQDINFSIAATDTDGDTLIAYCQLYVDLTSYGGVSSSLITDNLMSYACNASSLNTSAGEMWLAELWVGDGSTNTTKQNTSSSSTGTWVANLTNHTHENSSYMINFTTVLNANYTINYSLDGNSSNLINSFSNDTYNTTHFATIPITNAASYFTITTFTELSGSQETFGFYNVNFTCNESWSCGDWTECDGESQTRICTELTSCGTTFTRPLIQRNCSGGSASGGRSRTLNREEEVEEGVYEITYNLLGEPSTCGNGVIDINETLYNCNKDTNTTIFDYYDCLKAGPEQCIYHREYYHLVITILEILSGAALILYLLNMNRKV